MHQLTSLPSTTVNDLPDVGASPILRGMKDSSSLYADPVQGEEFALPVGKQANDGGSTVLLPLAVRWCSELPDDVRPELLPAMFPAIVNRLALVWQDPTKARDLLDELLIDRRGSRSGFPAGVCTELLRLHVLISKTAFDATPQNMWL